MISRKLQRAKDTFRQQQIMTSTVQYTIENDSNSVILLLDSAKIPSTAQWEITPIVQCWNSYRALQIKENNAYIYKSVQTMCI
jgi:hypothetical protein